MDAATVPLPAIQSAPPRSADGRGSRDLVVVGGMWRDDTGEQGAYRGHRRAARPIWLATAAVLAGAAIVVAAPLMIGSPPPPAEYSSAWEFEPAPAPTDDVDAALAASSGPAHSRRPTTAPAEPPVPLVAPGGGNMTTSAPLTLEAEEQWWSGSATRGQAACAQDVQIVRLIGDWTSTAPDNDGVLVFRRPPPAGAYTMTVHYVITEDSSRTAQIRFVGPNSVTITETFKAATCMTSRALAVTVPEGTTSIEFSNPTGRAPSIDKIIFTG
ncbi:MAG: hypothetical protein ACM30G_03625 [Micromonosporaceae bacterium]